MNRSWVRFPQAAQMRPPGSGWAFLYALLVACCLLLVAPTDLRPPRGLPARSPFVPACCCFWPRWCSGRRRARPPARLGDLTSFGAAPRSPPVPSGPSGALHTGGAWCADVWLCASSRRLSRPSRRPWAPQPGSPDPQCGLACRAGILGRSAVCCYKRRQSEVFFVWISDPLLQTSSIRRLFR